MIGKAERASRAGPSAWFGGRRREQVLGLISVVALLAAWQGAVDAGLVNEFDASKPTAVLAAGMHLAANGTLSGAVGITAEGFALGFGLSVAVGIPLGILIGWSRTLYGLTYPYIGALNATPRIALFPLFVVWFGIGLKTKVVIVFISAILPVLFNTITGVREVPADLIEVARCMGARTQQVLTSLALPGSLPYIMTGVRLGVGHALLATVIAELFIGSAGVGGLLNKYATYFETSQLMVLVLIVAAAGVLLLKVVEMLERKVAFWRPPS